MVYTPLNRGLPNRRENGISKRIREEKLMNNERYELQKGMYGNVYQIDDHERKLYYRQDMKIIEQLDLLDEPLPRYCDFCKTMVDEITTVRYKAVYEMIVRPHTNPEIKSDERMIRYAACDCCINKTVVPKQIISGHIVELYQEDKLIWKRGYLHCDGEIKLRWDAI